MKMTSTADGGYILEGFIPLDIILLTALATFLLWAWWFLRKGKK
jgi:hypothetical protein